MLLDLYFHNARIGRDAGSRVKHYAKAYLKREQQILVFESEADKEAFVDAEEQAKQAINRAARRKVIATKPKSVTVDLKAVSQELVTAQDYTQIIQDYFNQLEEEDIEALLFA